MKDLLKEAIADAKAVRETALANAKLALEEAFTPRLQSMLSAKLAEEMSEEDEDMPADEEMPMEGEDMDMEDHSEEDVTEGDEMPADEDDSEEMTEEEEMPAEEDDLDLEEIIRELEGEDHSEEDHSEEDMTEGDDMDMEDEEVTEGDDMEDEEDINIEEIIRSLREEDEADAEEAPAADDSEELEEAYNVIRFLKSKINEVNLLNAKLLYSNKLFRNFALNEGQKMKVIENFDRAHNLREVKLVFSTLAESFKAPKKALKESFASKPVASTKPQKQVIAEGADLAARFKKLAGLK